MSFQRKFTPEARTLLRHLPPLVKPHLRALTDKILKNPYEGKPLQKELAGYYSIRHGHYRVIYSINDRKKWVIIEYLGIRKTAYDIFAKLLRRI